MISLSVTVHGRIWQGHRCKHTYPAGQYATEVEMIEAVARWRSDLALVWRELAADFASVTYASFEATRTTTTMKGRTRRTVTETWPVMAGRRRHRGEMSGSARYLLPV